MPRRRLRLLAALGLLAATATAVAADLEREARLARDLRAAVRAGEPLLLDVPEPPAAPPQTASAAAPEEPEPQGTEAESPPGDGPPEEAPIPVPEGLAVDAPPAEAAEEPEKAPEPPADPEPTAREKPEKAPPGPRVFALFMPAADTPERGGVVLLHDLGGHPDWPDVVAPLRRRLPQDGWATLAVQMPLPTSGQSNNGPLLGEAVPRIEAAVTELTGRGYERVVLVGHGAGAAMAAAYLQGRERPEVVGAVVVNPGLPTQAPSGYDLTTPFTTAGIPVLNLYGNEAPYHVLDTAEGLAGSNITTIRVLGAGYAFDGMQTALVTRIRGWLRNAPLGKEETGTGEGNGEGGAG